MLTSVMTFNFLISNNDAHGKNFSVIHENTITLAPFYDLVSTQIYPSLDRKLAMAIGNTYRHDRVNEGAFSDFSKDMKLRTEKVVEMIVQTKQEVEKLYEQVLSVHERQYGKSEIYSDLHTVLRKNLARIQKMTTKLR